MFQREEDGWERAATVFEAGFVSIRLPGDCGSCGLPRLRGLFNPNEGRHRQSIANKTRARAESDVGYRPSRQAEEASAKAGNQNPSGYNRRRHKGFSIA